MRTALAYTSARILLFVAATGLLYLAGARSLVLLFLAALVSGIASYVVLSKQRDTISWALTRRLANGRQRATSFRARLEEGARAEDDDEYAGDESGGPGEAPGDQDALLPTDGGVGRPG
jgi:hypothetical protein